MIWTTSLTRPRPDAADVLWPTLGRLFHGNLPVRLRAWDGSEIGPPDRPVVILRDRQALRRLIRQPRELGLARAYIAGELDVDGDLTECLRLIWQGARDHGLEGGRLSPGRWVGAARAAVRLGIVGLPPEPPATEARISGLAHVSRRDPAVIGHHYDSRPDFCQLILGPQLTCSAALWAPGCQNLADAQVARLDEICARLRLESGMRLLDLGCGWGALAIHAARKFGARVTAVTQSGEQASFVERRAAELGLRSQLTVRTQDLKEISVLPQDAVAIGMDQHIGGLPVRFDQLRDQLRPGGRLLIQQMSHGMLASGAFCERYISPDLHMRPVNETISLLARAGFEISDVAAMHRDFTRTICAWQRNLERRWGDAVTVVGVESARVWRLCLAGVALAFEDGRMGVHQVVAVRRSARAASARPTGTRAVGTRTAETPAAAFRPIIIRPVGIHTAGIHAAGVRRYAHPVGAHAADARAAAARAAAARAADVG